MADDPPISSITSVCRRIVGMHVLVGVVYRPPPSTVTTTSCTTTKPQPGTTQTQPPPATAVRGAATVTNTTTTTPSSSGGGSGSKSKSKRNSRSNQDQKQGQEHALCETSTPPDAQRGFHPTRNPGTGWLKIPPAVPLSPAVPICTRVSAGMNTPMGRDSSVTQVC